MIPTFKIDVSKIKPLSREEQLKKLDEWKKSQEELERICKEKGIPVPEIVCHG